MHSLLSNRFFMGEVSRVENLRERKKGGGENKWIRLPHIFYCLLCIILTTGINFRTVSQENVECIQSIPY